MTNVLDNFIQKKKDESAFVTLKDGESENVKLLDVKVFEKPDFKGELKEVLRFVVEVETESGMKTKNFDNGTARFAQEITEKEIVVGSTFTITRIGLQTNTRYELTNVVNPPEQGTLDKPATPATPDKPKA